MALRVCEPGVLTRDLKSLWSLRVPSRVSSRCETWRLYTLSAWLLCGLTSGCRVTLLPRGHFPWVQGTSTTFMAFGGSSGEKTGVHDFQWPKSFLFFFLTYVAFVPVEVSPSLDPLVLLFAFPSGLLELENEDLCL